MPPGPPGIHPANRWYVDETYVKVDSAWRYIYPAIDQHGQVIDVLAWTRRDAQATRWFFSRRCAP